MVVLVEEGCSVNNASPRPLVAAGGDPLLLQNLPRRFSHRELHAATNGFSDQNKLGSGFFSIVYKNNMIAVKRLIKFSVAESPQDEHKQFENEARLMQLRHGNIVQVLGYCCDKQHRLLCYEYMANGSLDKFLFGKSVGLVLLISYVDVTSSINYS
ncbi:hypothetical protein BAE44_0026196 [Dichanthelium oligosanthes]|uniref:Protein kinase domain-containing protein n=1 Tax=Dichanthelium oligosanthes TaxID=888268 RepID=A0A1E5UJ18_9POAL|nr:hypothetical protein BAE44_0026196 [Dichanthelium oligosanthes]